ncbi:MAG: hypothetical protein HOP32_09975 [Nitrospira sp.]|nr:hypothetical protein [Nitrospira sp.]
MKSIASVLSVIALGLALFSCSGGGGGGGGSTQAFAVSTTAADFGVVDNAYTSTLATTGGTAPFTWTLFGGVLPTGLPAFSIDPGTGVVSGTPTVADNFTATFTVTDSAGQTATGSVLFAIHPRTDRVSVNSSGTAGNGTSTEPAISSANGRFIAFTSLATLAPTPGGSGAQIFAHDRQTGQPSLVSINSIGNAGDGASSQPTISADGRYVAFTSVAPNLAPIPGAIGSQIFLRDTQSNTTVLVSQDAVGNAGNGASSEPTISADGRFVAFTSAATNLAPIIGGSGSQIFLRDTQANQTILVSRDTMGNAGNGASSEATISGNGQFVAFTSQATNLASLVGGSGSQIFLRDTIGNATTLVSRDTTGNAGNGASSHPTIGATNGQFVAFTSLATNLAATLGGSGSQIYLRDTQGNQTSLVSKDNSVPANAGNGASSAPAVVGDGGFVAFASGAATLVSGGNAASQVYVRAMP